MEGIDEIGIQVLIHLRDNGRCTLGQISSGVAGASVLRAIGELQRKKYLSSKAEPGVRDDTGEYVVPPQTYYSITPCGSDLLSEKLRRDP